MAWDDWKKKNDFVLGKKKGVERMRSAGKPATQNVKEQAEAVTREVRELMEKVEVHIEQLNQLYNQYVAGVDQIPPIESRKRLESDMLKLTSSIKTTPALRFRYNGINNRFVTYRDKWEKMLRDLESGKIGHQRKKKKIYF